MSDTPRTDALFNPLTGIKPTIHFVFEHARQLERELTRIQSAEMPNKVIRYGEDMHGEFGQWSDGEYVSYSDYVEMKAYAERKEAELSDAVHLNDEQSQRVFRAEAEARGQRERAERYKGIADAFQVDWNKEIDMREKAERERDALIAKYSRLMEAAEMPVEPESIKALRGYLKLDIRWQITVNAHQLLTCAEYIDALQAVIQRKEAEAKEPK